MSNKELISEVEKCLQYVTDSLDAWGDRLPDNYYKFCDDKYLALLQSKTNLLLALSNLTKGVHMV